MSFCTTSRKSRIKFSYFVARGRRCWGGAISRPFDVSSFAQSSPRQGVLLIRESASPPPCSSECSLLAAPSLLMDLASPERAEIYQLADAGVAEAGGTEVWRGNWGRRWSPMGGGTKFWGLFGGESFLGG